MNLTEKPIGGITGDFQIEAYQRGYRWSKDEIEHLLDDIQEVPEGKNYCLQPIVVKPVNGHYELIDGQQRLTTLYLIMQYLNAYIDIKYSIEYTTRKSENGYMGSKELLESIDSINLDSPSSNIDELFIKNAYKIIKAWFHDDKKTKIKIAQKLQEFVSVIWYEVDEKEDSTNIFTRLNIGKISLTNAELVKALFLSKPQKCEKTGKYKYIPGIDEKTQHEIALEWDQMEKELHDDKFWAFITNAKIEDYPIRMELLFDIIENKPAGESSYYTFNRFYEQFKESENKYQTWETIVRYYQRLKEWYQDFDLYHQIGFLISCGKDIKDLLSVAMNTENPLTKSEFKEEILKSIQDMMIFKVGVGTPQEEELEYSELSYENHPEFIHKLLLLFNVETIRQKRDEHNRFPFDRYKSQGTWSLEHIHAQNSESLKTNKDWKEWLETHKKSLEILIAENDNSSDLKTKILDTLDKLNAVLSHLQEQSYNGSIRDEFHAVSTLVTEILTDGNDSSQMHSLSNMALLTVGENAALNNSTFDVKRAKIIELDRNGEYLPTCTRNVFLKYYSQADTKFHFWSEEDRKDYINAINDVLYHHQTSEGKEIKLIKSEIRYGNK